MTRKQAAQLAAKFDLSDMHINMHPAAVSLVGKTIKQRPETKRIMQLVMAHHPHSCRATTKTKH